MHIFKSLILLLMVTISTTIHAAAAAAPVAEPTRATTGGILTPIVATFLSHEITADNARQHFQDLRDHSVHVFACGAHTYELKDVTAANKTAIAKGKMVPYPLSKESLPVSIAHHTTELRAVYSSAPNETELKVTKLIARGITKYPKADIKTILFTSIDPSLSLEEADLWVLLWDASR